jgi:hypothetical protein
MLASSIGGVVDLASDVVGISSSALSNALPPVISIATTTTEAITDSGVALTHSGGGMVNMAGNVVSSIGSPTVESALSALGHSVAASANPSIDEAGSAVDSIGGTALHAIDGPLDLAAVNTPSHAVSNLQSSFSADVNAYSNAGLASGGTMDFPPSQGVKLPTNELFANGSHTNYGIALTSDSGAPSTGVTPDVDLKTALADVAHQAADHSSGAPEKADDHASLPQTSLASDLTTTFDHAGSHVHNLL